MKSKALIFTFVCIFSGTCCAQDVILLTLKSRGKIVAQKSFDTSSDLEWDRTSYQVDSLSSGRCEKLRLLPIQHGVFVGRDIKINRVATSIDGATIFMVEELATRRVGTAQTTFQDCDLNASLTRRTQSLNFVSLKAGEAVTVPALEGSDELLQIEIHPTD